MYKKFFGLVDTPFSIAPNPHYLYMSHQHREALAHLLYGIKRDGFITLTGEVGTGKTTVCRCFLEQIPEDTNVAFILNPKLTVNELLATICDELEIGNLAGESRDVGDDSAKDYVDAINEYLLLAHAEDRKTLLIIDEAQNLSIDVLEQIRLLTNLETNQRKLLQIILIGQPELRDLFAKPELRQLAQRITARYHLERLTVEESIAYVKHRLSVAGTQEEIFSVPVIKLLHRISGGIPRVINVICDRALLGAYVQDRRIVDKKTLGQAAKEVLGGNNETQLIRRVTKERGLNFSYGRLAGLFVIGLVIIGAQLVVEPLNRLIKGSFDSSSGTTAETIEFRPPTVLPVMEFETQSPDELYSAMDLILEKEFSILNEKLKENDNLAQPILEGEEHREVQPLLSQIQDQQEEEQNLQAGPKQSVLEQPVLEQSVLEQSVLEQLWPDNYELALSMYDAYDVIFERWQINYEVSKHGGDPCQFANQNGLGCLQKTGDLSHLKSLDRPAVLKFYRENGQHFYLPLVSLDDRTATLKIAGAYKIVKTESIMLQWQGEYTIVWQLPPKYHGAIVLGTIGPEVKWLSKKLAKVQENIILETGISYYDDVMEKKIKLFQRMEGITADGVVGPQTFIKLNTASGENVPQLAQRKNANLEGSR
ncbi:MAG: AAA family ATPase [Pseudomonadales bacterium]|nr:AAA family ATPase [Pseudomonadales bacterium]